MAFRRSQTTCETLGGLDTQDIEIDPATIPFRIESWLRKFYEGRYTIRAADGSIIRHRSDYKAAVSLAYWCAHDKALYMETWFRFQGTVQQKKYNDAVTMRTLERAFAANPEKNYVPKAKTKKKSKPRLRVKGELPLGLKPSSEAWLIESWRLDEEARRYALTKPGRPIDASNQKVLEMFNNGLSRKEIAAKLGVSYNKVKKAIQHNRS